MINLMDLFARIKWAELGGVAEIAESDYKAGWAFLGDDTPTVQDFNYIQQMNDLKDKWLYNQINEVLKAANIKATEAEKDLLLKAIKKIASGYGTPLKITAATKNVVSEKGHNHEIDKAGITQAGIVQLSNETDSNDETKAPTLKALKTVADRLKQFVNNILNNYIPNSKKSSAVNSPSADTVATSAAVKTAYDLAVAAVPNSKKSNAVNSPSGDTVATSAAVKTAYDKAQQAENIANSKQSPATTLQGYGITNAVQQGGGKGQMTNKVFIGWSSGLRLKAQVDITDLGNIVFDNHLAPYLLKSIFDNLRNKFTYAQYSGAGSISRVFRVPLTANTGFKIYTTLLTINANLAGHRFRLAEAMTGLRLGFATATRADRASYGVAFDGDSTVVIHCPVTQGQQVVNLLLISEYQY